MVYIADNGGVETPKGLRHTLVERSTEIKMKLEKELTNLEVPCSVADLMKRTGASRLPIEKHLANMLEMEKFSDLSMARVGATDIVYRRVKKS